MKRTAKYNCHSYTITGGEKKGWVGVKKKIAFHSVEFKPYAMKCNFFVFYLQKSM